MNTLTTPHALKPQSSESTYLYTCTFRSKKLSTGAEILIYGLFIPKHCTSGKKWTQDGIIPNLCWLVQSFIVNYLNLDCYFRGSVLKKLWSILWNNLPKGEKQTQQLFYKTRKCETSDNILIKIVLLSCFRQRRNRRRVKDKRISCSQLLSPHGSSMSHFNFRV